MKKTLLATTALAFVAAHASAVDVELYGQVNKGLFGYNDGEDTNVVVIDNALSSTRFGFKGAQALDNGLTASVLFEGEMASNPSNGFTQASNSSSGGTQTTPGNTSPSFTERQARVGLSGGFGGVYLGQQSTAIDSVALQDLAGVGDVMNAEYHKIGGGLGFRTSAVGNGVIGGAGTATFTPNNMSSSIHQNRDDSVRYDSPIFAGFQGRASIAQGGDTELSAFYDGAIAGLKVKGAAGVQFNNDNTGGTGALLTANQVERQYAASVSVAHDSGLAGTLAYVGQSLENETAGSDDGQGWYAKVGYAWDAYEVAVDYGNNEHFSNPTAANDELTSWGLGVQHNMGNGVSVAGLYRNYDADVTGSNTESIDLYGVNMRVKF